MSTFSQKNAKAAESGVPKDTATKEDVKTADEGLTTGTEIPADNPQQPIPTLEETSDEAGDRHLASTELPVEDVTDPATQSDSVQAEDAKEKLVPGAAEGPKPDGSVLNDQGKVAYAPPGSYNAAVQGVQEDAAGHVDSVGTDNSPKSNTRT